MHSDELISAAQLMFAFIIEPEMLSSNCLSRTKNGKAKRIQSTIASKKGKHLILTFKKWKPAYLSMLTFGDVEIESFKMMRCPPRTRMFEKCPLVNRVL